MMRIVLSFALALCLVASLGTPADADAPDYFAVHIPAGIAQQMEIDGELGDWSWFPSYAVIPRDALLSRAGPDGLDLGDFDVNIRVAWTGANEGNQVWIGINTFDDFFDRDLLRGSRTVGDDGWTFGTDPDHSGGGISVDGIASNGQEWTVQAAGDEDLFALQGFSDSYTQFWGNQPPHLIFATGPASDKPWTHGDENVTINYEWRMTLFSFFDAVESTGEGGAETSTVIDLTEGISTHLVFQGDDWDGGDSWDGAWATSNESGATGNGDSMNSFELIVDPDVEAGAPTAVSSTTWARIKSEFAD
jgi:hypothetical protein